MYTHELSAYIHIHINTNTYNFWKRKILSVPQRTVILLNTLDYNKRIPVKGGCAVDISENT